MKIRRVLAMCKYEFIVAVLASLMAIPTIVPQSQATAVIGGGDGKIDCYEANGRNCRQLPNNDKSSCTGNYMMDTKSWNSAQEKKMKTETWCSSCSTDVTQFDLVASDNCKTRDVEEEYENIP